MHALISFLPMHGNFVVLSMWEAYTHSFEMAFFLYTCGYSSSWIYYSVKFQMYLVIKGVCFPRIPSQVIVCI